MDTAAALEIYRANFFREYQPILVKDLRPGMRIVIPDDPQDYGGGDLFMEVAELRTISNGQTTIVGKLTCAHSEVGDVGASVVAVSPFEHVGKQHG